MSKNQLPESARTVIFTEEEAELISEIVSIFNTEQATESLEKVAQNLFNTVGEGGLMADIGYHYFILCQIRRFHSGLIDRLRPVGEAYQEVERVHELQEEE